MQNSLEDRLAFKDLLIENGFIELQEIGKRYKLRNTGRYTCGFYNKRLAYDYGDGHIIIASGDIEDDRGYVLWLYKINVGKGLGDGLEPLSDSGRMSLEAIRQYIEGV